MFNALSNEVGRTEPLTVGTFDCFGVITRWDEYLTPCAPEYLAFSFRLGPSTRRYLGYWTLPFEKCSTCSRLAVIGKQVAHRNTTFALVHPPNDIALHRRRHLKPNEVRKLDVAPSDGIG